MKNGKIKIAIDIDDCICNTVDADFSYGYYYAQEKGLLTEGKDYDNSYFEVTETFNIPKDKVDDFHISEKKFLMKNNNMFPFAFASSVINLLYQHCEIIFLTARNEKYFQYKALSYTKKWLKKFKFKYDKVVISQEKQKFCIENGIDLVIEDRNAKLFNDVGIPTILMLKSYNRNYNNLLSTHAINFIHLFDIINKKYFNNELKLEL